MASTVEVLVTEYAGKDTVSAVVEKIAKANEALHDKLEKVRLPARFPRFVAGGEFVAGGVRFVFFGEQVPY